MVPLGIPYSEFLTWSEDDQDLAKAYLRLQRTKCQRCGTIPEDWLDEDGTYIEPQPFVVTTERCLGCESIKDERSRLEKEREYNIGLVRNPDRFKE